jgi:hypothetical protein
MDLMKILFKVLAESWGLGYGTNFILAKEVLEFSYLIAI